MNLVKLSFVFNALSAGLGGLVINLFERHVPAAFSKLYRHGKFCADVRDAFLDRCEVPKRWFRHFYVLAGPLSTAALAMIVCRYYFDKKLPDVVAWSLRYLLGATNLSFVPPENVILAISIFTIHCWKRFYETHYISVFSDVYMNFAVYLIGLCHYIGVVVSIVGESEGLLKNTKITLNLRNLSYLDIFCAAVFLISTYAQLRANLILSNLRKDKKGNVVTKKYKIPHGELFNYVTAPLQFTEIIMYLCLSIILRSASTFHFVTIWVVVNQVECAYLSHQWSLKTFEDYPKSRKIIIPFIY